jgi:hypothetical protein
LENGYPKERINRSEAGGRARLAFVSQPALSGAFRMPLNAQQTRLAVTIDRHVNQVMANGGGDEELLRSMFDHMCTFKQLLDTCSREEMDGQKGVPI